MMTAPDTQLKVDVASVHYIAMGGVRERIAASLAATFGGLGDVLDVGTGEGFFAHALAGTGAATSVLGIDPHAVGIANASLIARHRKIDSLCRFAATTLDEVDATFDTITLFLALADLLREARLDVLARALRARLAPCGRLVVCAGFPETAADSAEALGFALHAAIGYVLPSRDMVRTALGQAGFRVFDLAAETTDAEVIGPREMAHFLLRENRFAIERGAAAADVGRLWAEVAPLVCAAGGEARLDARIDVVAAVVD